MTTMVDRSGSMTDERRRRRRPGARLALALLAAALVLVVLPRAAAADVDFTVKGQWLCNNRGTDVPVSGARVELWQSNSYWFDDKLGSVRTGTNGSFAFGVRSDDNFDLYAKLVLNDDSGVNLGEWYSFSDWNTDTNTLGSHSGTVNLGTWEVSKDNGSGTPKCAVWQGAHNAYADFQHLTGSVPPDRDYTIDADFPCCGTPFTTLDTTRWPSNYPTGDGPKDPEAGFDTNFHEFAHSVRHSLDGGFTHFLYDVARFNYAQNHTLCQVTNPGFAFNEGWAEYWARTPQTCTPDPTNMSQEGNVATALTSLERCSGRVNLLRVLKANPGAIHSYTEFYDHYLAMFGRRPCLISTISTNLGTQIPLSQPQLISRLQGQIDAQQALVNQLQSQRVRARRVARAPGQCAAHSCGVVVDRLSQPFAVAAQIAQANLVLQRLQQALAAAKASRFVPDFGQLSYYQMLDSQRAAFQRASQTALIAGLRQTVSTIRSSGPTVRSRSTARLRLLNQTIDTLKTARAKGRDLPVGLESQFAPPTATGDDSRQIPHSPPRTGRPLAIQVRMR